MGWVCVTALQRREQGHRSGGFDLANLRHQVEGREPPFSLMTTYKSFISHTITITQLFKYSIAMVKNKILHISSLQLQSKDIQVLKDLSDRQVLP